MTARRHNVIHIHLQGAASLIPVFGPIDCHLRQVEERFNVVISARGDQLEVEGASGDLERVRLFFDRLMRWCREDAQAGPSDVADVIDMLMRDPKADVNGIMGGAITLPGRRRAIRPRSEGQKVYLEKIRTHDIVFSVGPAGTGKSYLAVAMGVHALLSDTVERVILARPAVEAGEKLGFLPGSMEEKINPYLRPLYDALHDMIDPDRVKDLIEADAIEVAPLAFMRGRTLHRAFVILDEAQNTSSCQMKMMLTRLGVDSRMVVTGDVTQIDLPRGEPSGLVEAMRLLEGVRGIAFHAFDESDIVRHPLVGRIVAAYEAEVGRVSFPFSRE